METISLLSLLLEMNIPLQSGGAAFSSNNLIDAKPNQKRQFAQVTAKRIVESLVATEIEEDCMCVQDHGYVGHTHCKIVGRKEKEQVLFSRC